MSRVVPTLLGLWGHLPSLSVVHLPYVLKLYAPSKDCPTRINMHTMYLCIEVTCTKKDCSMSIK
jgi:hypothetical protein